MLSTAQITRKEILLVAALLFTGFAVRLVCPTWIAVEHYDEGVYASSLWFGPESYFAYPQLHLYAPPLVPNLIETGIIVVGPRWGVMLPGLAAGCLTLVIVWWMARSWFGAPVGTATLTLAVFSDLHQLYTRTALVDAILLMWFLLALYFFVRAIEKQSLLAIGGAGVCTGLAWSTKYNGWLPLAISATALVAWLFFSRTAVMRSLRIWASVTLIACLVWSPVFLRLIRLEAVMPVITNHRQYAVGWSGWWEAMLQQYSNHRHLEGNIGCLGLGVAVIAAITVCGRGPQSLWIGNPISRRSAWCSAILLFVLLSTAASLIGTSTILALLSVIALVPLAARVRRETQPEQKYVAFLLFVWLVSLAIATPLYYPYPRLTLPWLACIWILGGLGIVQTHAWVGERVASWSREKTHGATSWSRQYLVGILVVCTAAGGVVFATSNSVRWEMPAITPRNQFESIAEEIQRESHQAANGQPCLLLVYAEPAVYFHLKAIGTENVVPLQNFSLVADSSEVPTFIVTGPHGQRTKEYADEWPQVAPRLDLLQTYKYRPSELVRINLFDARSLGTETRKPFEIRLYRVESGGSPLTATGAAQRWQSQAAKNPLRGFRRPPRRHFARLKKQASK